MAFKIFGKNRVKRIADILEKIGIALFSLVAANSVFLAENTKGNDAVVKTALIYSISLIVVSYMLTFEEAVASQLKKQKGKK